MITMTEAQKIALRDSADPVFYVVLINVSGSTWPDSKIAHLFSQRPVDHSSPVGNYAYYEDRMTDKSIRGIKASFDPRKRGGIAQIGTLEFSISNHGSFFEGQEDLGVYYSGCEVLLSLNFETTTVSGDIILWYGVVREVERDVVNDQIIFTCEDLGVTFDKPVPPNSYNSDDSDPLGTRGAPIPLVFGRHEVAQGIKAESITNQTGVNDSYGPKYVFSDPGVYPILAINNPVFGDDGLVEATGGVATLDSAVTPYGISLADGAFYFTDVAPESIGIIADINLSGMLAVKGGTYPPGYTADDPQWLNVTDDNLSSYATISVTASLDDEVFYVKIPNITTAGSITMLSGNVPKIYAGYKASTYFATSFPTETHYLMLSDSRDVGSYSTHIPAGNGAYNYFLPIGSAGSYYISSAAASDETVTFGDYVPANQWASGGLSALGSALVGFGLWGYGYLTRIRCYEAIDLRVYATVDTPTDSGIYADVSGFKDTGSGTYTGSASALIEEPADMAYFFVDKMMETTSLVDSASFTALRTSFSGWKFARQITKRDDAYKVLESMASDAGFWVVVDALGFIKATTVQGSMSDDFIIHPADVIDGQIKSAKQSDIKDVVTDYLFKYKHNPIIDDYQETLHCKSSSSSTSIGATYEAICTTAKARYTANRDAYKEFEFPWVRDAATAALVAKQIISLLGVRRWTIEFESDLAMAYVELGDRFTMAAGLWPDLPSDLVSEQFVVSSVSIDPTKFRVKIKATEAII